MIWIKRNLFFAVGSVVALALLAAAFFYGWQNWSHNETALGRLNETYKTLQEMNNQPTGSVDAIRDQEKKLRAWMREAEKYFQPMAPIPSPANGPVTGENFAAALHRTIDQMQRAADSAGVSLPPKYGFSFEAERPLVKFAPNSLAPLSRQLGEVKGITEVLFAAKVNALDNVQRLHVSDDDVNGPQSDYLTDQPVVNNLGTLTPYAVTFRGFSGELSQVVTGFATSPHGFIIKAINVEPAGSALTPTDAVVAPPVAAGRGGLQTILNEQLLRVTLVVEVVKLAPRR